MSDEYVEVPIPARWLAEIYQRMAELAAAEAKSTRPLGDPASPSEVRLDDGLLEDMFFESQAPHRRLIAFLAQHPDRWFYTSDLASELELEHGSKGLAGMLGAFSRRAKNRYGGLTPWESAWDASRGEARHRMSADVAELVQNFLVDNELA